MSDGLHLVLTGNYRAAIDDWRERLVSFDRDKMRGVDTDGRSIIFASIENPDRLLGLRISSWEEHSTVRDWGHWSRKVAECREICRHITRTAGAA